ncbi:MAG: GTP 3',8-cyclase MoaA [Desulfobacterales bacterium]|nr:MAG: GTP 3',8-cyclase MoaA [Desulfobacterales bacterium]
MADLIDEHGRHIDYLRISITDHCNLDCFYCTPFGGRTRMSHKEILRYEEVLQIVEAAVIAGISKVRITGGEPLVRKGMVELCRMLADIEGLESLALTTNGVFLDRWSLPLFEAGVRRINVSLDTLIPDRYRHITGGNYHHCVLNGIERAEAVGFFPIKINTVVMRGINDDEIEDFARLTFEKPFHVRFIELMPTNGQSSNSQASLFVPVEEMIRQVKSVGDLCLEHETESFGPARMCHFKGGIGKVGFITPMSRHFCNACNRLRLTAEGKLRTCLFSDKEINIKKPLRAGASTAELADIFRRAVKVKPQKHDLTHNRHELLGRAMYAIGG